MSCKATHSPAQGNLKGFTDHTHRVDGTIFLGTLTFNLKGIICVEANNISLRSSSPGEFSAARKSFSCTRGLHLPSWKLTIPPCLLGALHPVAVDENGTLHFIPL